MRVLHKIGLLGLLLLTACGLPDHRIKRQVAENEVVGTWELDPASSALAVDHDGDDYAMEPGRPHTIVFNVDGTCHYRSVLQMPTRYVDAAGTWRIIPTAAPPTVPPVLNSHSEPVELPAIGPAGVSSPKFVVVSLVSPTWLRMVTVKSGFVAPRSVKAAELASVPSTKYATAAALAEGVRARLVRLTAASRRVEGEEA